MFKENDFVVLIDTKGKKYIFELKTNSTFHFHRGQIKHNDIIGRTEGSLIYSSRNEKLIALKPTLAEFILHRLKRAGQIIYPKDIGQILVLGDIFKGAKVFECGCGSGALTLFLLEVIGEKGSLVSIDIREDMIEIAKNNIENFYKKPIDEIQNLKLLKADIKEIQLPKEEFDRAIIDINTPWEILDKIYEILKPSCIALFWLPTVLQVFNLLDKVENTSSQKFFIEGIYETLQREWKKRGLSLRPKDRMVAHTGFLIILRKISI